MSLSPNLFMSMLPLLVCFRFFDAGGEEGWLVLYSASRGCTVVIGSVSRVFGIVDGSVSWTVSAA